MISSTGIIVTLNYSGTATSGSDYTGVTVNITIPAGNTGISFVLTGLQDVISETGNETIIPQII